MSDLLLKPSQQYSLGVAVCQPFPRIRHDLNFSRLQNQRTVYQHLLQKKEEVTISRAPDLRKRRRRRRRRRGRRRRRRGGRGRRRRRRRRGRERRRRRSEGEEGKGEEKVVRTSRVHYLLLFSKGCNVRLVSVNKECDVGGREKLHPVSQVLCPNALQLHGRYANTTHIFHASQSSQVFHFAGK